MATDLETNIRTALEKLAKALADAAEVTIETRYKVVADLQNPGALEKSNTILVARTVIQLDGDQEAIIPVTATETGSIVIEDMLLDLHQRNVQAAIEYRKEALNTLVNISRRRSL